MALAEQRDRREERDGCGDDRDRADDVERDRPADLAASTDGTSEGRERELERACLDLVEAKRVPPVAGEQRRACAREQGDVARRTGRIEPADDSRAGDGGGCHDQPGGEAKAHEVPIDGTPMRLDGQ